MHGASIDLQHAAAKVEQFIMEYGTNDEYLHYSFITNNELLGISDQMTDNIRKKCMEFVKKTYVEAEKLLKEHKDGISRVAELLMKEAIISAKDSEMSFRNEKPKEIKQRVKTH